MIHQLRIYEIFEQNKAAFHDRFRNHASRIMRTYGFEIVSAWESRTGDRTEFLYLLAWPDEKTMQESWNRFRADDEWKEIKRVTNAKHGDLVGVIQEKVLLPTDYGPTLPTRTGAKSTRRFSDKMLPAPRAIVKQHQTRSSHTEQADRA